jgi:hypothetical protein
LHAAQCQETFIKSLKKLLFYNVHLATLTVRTDSLSLSLPLTQLEVTVEQVRRKERVEAMIKDECFSDPPILKPICDVDKTVFAKQASITTKIRVKETDSLMLRTDRPLSQEFFVL